MSSENLIFFGPQQLFNEILCGFKLNLGNVVLPLLPEAAAANCEAPTTKKRTNTKLDYPDTSTAT